MSCEIICVSNFINYHFNNNQNIFYRIFYIIHFIFETYSF